MTISSTVRIAGPFTGNGVTTTFPFTYKVFSTADVQVIRLTISTGLETTLTIVTDYTITLNGDQDSNPGGNIVLVAALSALYKLTATSDIANLQPTDLTNQGGFYPEVITDALDRATIQIQQISDIGDRTLKIPISDGALNMELPTAASRANSFLAFGATGLPTVVTAGSSGAPTTMTRQNFSGTGSQVAFTLASDPGALGNSAEVFIGGVYQNKNTYTISGLTLTFSAAPVAGTDNIEFVNFLTDAIGSTSADLVTYTPAGTGAVARSAQAKMRDTVSVKDFGAVGDGVADDAAAIQAAIDFVKTQTGGIVFFPAGRYRITTRLKIQNTYASNICIKLCGVGNGNSNVYASSTRGSLIIGETALTSQMMVEMSGGSNITFEDIGLYAGTTNPSTIGIYLQRVQATGNGYCAHNNFTRISIGMGTNPTANGNVGTIAILNKRGEHHYHNECRYTADTPLILAGVAGADTAYSPAYSPSILSPDYVESYPGGATMGLNSLTNCLLIAYSKNTVEAYAPSNCSWSNCYFLVADGKAGMYMQFAKSINVDNALVEYTGSGTSLAFMRLQGDCRGINVSALTNLSSYALIKTVGGTSLGNSNINAIGAWGSVFDHATEGGGYLYGSTVSLDSLTGSSVPTAGLVNCVVLDGNDVANQNADFRFASAATSFVTGYGAVTDATDGNDTITSATTTYISEINITASKTVNTALVLVGTAGAGNYKIYLIDWTGNVVAQTASFAVAVTGQFIGNNFSTSYFANGPGKYFLAVQCDNAASANRIRTFPVGGFAAVARTGITYGSLANNAANAPSSFVANVAPIAYIY
jgi:hypothetical protein